MTDEDKPDDYDKDPPSRAQFEEKLVKALDSPVLNGGFDRLMMKVENIEASQNTLVSKINDVHEAMYNPDRGLFARIKNEESARSIEIIELQAWREYVNKDLLLDAEQDKDLKHKVDSHEITISELTLHKNRVVSAVKWIVVAISGGIISLIFKWLTTLV